MAWQDLSANVSYRLRTGHRNSRTPPPVVTLDSLAAFLSGRQMPGMNPYSSIFTLARQTSSRLGVSWSFNRDRSISLSTKRRNYYNRAKVFRSLRESLRASRSYGLRCKPDQGKTLPCFSKSKVSAHYNRTGDFIRFTDWWFIHKAKLNLLTLNAVGPVQKKDPNRNLSCRLCNHPFKGLPHVLCNCKKNLVKITNRHNLIVGRLQRVPSGSWTVLKKNQPLAGSSLRPDLVLVKNNCVMILDVAVTFENGPLAFDKIRNEKLRKLTS